MTDTEILALAAPHLSTPDASIPTLRGNESILSFARQVIAEHERKRWRELGWLVMPANASGTVSEEQC